MKTPGDLRCCESSNAAEPVSIVILWSPETRMLERLRCSAGYLRKIARRSSFLSAVTVVLLLLLEATLAPAADFVVDSTVDAIDAMPGDGICAADTGNCTIRAAIIETNQLAGYDTIHIPEGVYVLSIPGGGEDDGLTGDLDVLDDLSLLGAGSNSTIIDGNQLDTVLSLHANGESFPMVANVSDIAITNGSASGLDILNSFYPGYMDATVTDCIIENNSAGGIVEFDSELALLRTSVVHNDGPGVYAPQLYSSEISIEHSLVSDNGGKGLIVFSGGYGGGIFVGSTVVENNSSGGLWSGEASVVVEDSLFRGNLDGPALSIDGNSMRILRTSIEDNFGSLVGGVEYFGNGNGSLEINDSAIVRNAGSAGTGGLAVRPLSMANIETTTISQNVGSRVGGLLVDADSSLRLSNVTIAENQGDIIGGLGRDNLALYSIELLIESTIIARNESAAATNDCGGLISAAMGIVSLGGNLLGDGTACPFTARPDDLVGTATLPIDPLLGPLAQNGGPTQTHALRPGSPALDAAGSSCVASDQRGAARPFDADGDGFALCDTGAYESGDYDGDGIYDLVDNCEAIANSDQEDTDADALGDVCDPCSSYPGDDADGDGLGCALDNCPLVPNADQADTDGDLVGDACDNCATTANPGQANSDADPLGNACDNCRVQANVDQTDVDGDLVGDICDGCPTAPNAAQSDGDGDGVQDACDNCVSIFNPRVHAGWLAANPWSVLTGGQRDDDADGFGNRCDAKFPGASGALVASGDLAQYRASSGKSIASMNCGSSGALPCGIFDLDENGGLISSGDLAQYRWLSGKTPGPKCAACPFECEPGALRSCSP